MNHKMLVDKRSYAHTQQHIGRSFEKSPQTGQPLFHASLDTFMNEHTLKAPGTMAAVLLWRKTNKTFCAVSPSGQHAEHDQPIGFYFFNKRNRSSSSYAWENKGKRPF